MKTGKFLIFLGLLLIIALIGNTNPSLASFLSHSDISIQGYDASLENTADVLLGTPGTSYRYIKTFGVTDEAYLADTTHLNRPSGLFMDSSNQLFIVEEVGFRVLGYDSSGTSIFQVGKAGFADTSRDHLGSPADIAKDANGYLWVADMCRIIQYDGSGAFQQSFPAEDNNPWQCGSEVDRLNDVAGIAFDDATPAQHMFVSNWGSHNVRVFTLDTTQPTAPPVYRATIGSFDGEAGNDVTHFNHPKRLAVDSSDRLYVIDEDNGRVQRCQGTSGVGDPWQTWTCEVFLDQVNGTYLNVPRGITVAPNGNIFITDSNNGRLIRWNGAVFSEFITGFPGYIDDVAVDSLGNVFVSNWRSAVHKYNSSGTSSNIFVGVLDIPYLTTSPLINKPWGLGLGTDGSVYVGEDYGRRVVKFLSDGSQAWAFGVAGVEGSDNSHLGAYWGAVMGKIAVDSVNNRVYVPDTPNCRVVFLDVTTGSYIGQFGTCGSGETEFSQPRGVSINPTNGDIFVTDHEQHRVQIYSSQWIYKGTIGVTNEQGTDNSHLSFPYGVAITVDGVVYIPDQGNHRLQKCTSVDGVHYDCSTFVGTTGLAGNDYGQLNSPWSCAVDLQGNVYIGNVNRVDVYNEQGAYLTTIGGLWGSQNGNVDSPFGLAIDSTRNVYITNWAHHRVQKFALGVPGWQQVNINGFGEQSNGGVIAMEVFGSRIYASAANWNQGARIWRSENGTDWTAVTEPGFGNVYGSSNPAIVDMVVFNDKLYASTGWGGSPFQIWRTSNGVNWEQVEDSGFGIVENTAVEAFEIFNNQIYVAVQNMSTGAQIWRSSSGNPDSWGKVKEGFDGNVDSYRSTGMAVYNNKLYAAIENDFTGTEMWETSDGLNWTQINTDGFGTANNWVQGGPVVYKNEMYIGTNNLVTGGQLWKYNGVTWSKVVDDGFGNTNLESLLVFGDDLYVGAGNDITGMEVWKLPGASPEQISIDGFGDSNNGSSLWSNAQAVFNGYMYWGTWNWANGGEIWRYDTGYFPVFLPLVKR